MAWTPALWAQLASVFRDAGSPLVFATDVSLQVSEVGVWTDGYIGLVSRGSDALDALYDQLKSRPLPRMTPGMDE